MWPANTLQPCVYQPSIRRGLSDQAAILVLSIACLYSLYYLFFNGYSPLGLFFIFAPKRYVAYYITLASGIVRYLISASSQFLNVRLGAFTVISILLYYNSFLISSFYSPIYRLCYIYDHYYSSLYYYSIVFYLYTIFYFHLLYIWRLFYA